MKNILEIIRNFLVEKYPHLDNGALETFTKGYCLWLVQIVLAFAGTLILATFLFAMFNHFLNITNGDKRAARKFWTKLSKNL